MTVAVCLVCHATIRAEVAADHDGSAERRQRETRTAERVVVRPTRNPSADHLSPSQRHVHIFVRQFDTEVLGLLA